MVEHCFCPVCKQLVKITVYKKKLICTKCKTILLDLDPQPAKFYKTPSSPLFQPMTRDEEEQTKGERLRETVQADTMKAPCKVCERLQEGKTCPLTGETCPFVTVLVKDEPVLGFCPLKGVTVAIKFQNLTVKRRERRED